MPVVVTLSLPNRTLLVEAEKLEKDPHIEANLLLFGTKNLVLPAPDEEMLITKVWSVPRSMIQFYAVGHHPAPASAPAVPVPAAEPPPFLEEAAKALETDRARVEVPEKPKATRGRKAKAEPTA